MPTIIIILYSLFSVFSIFAMEAPWEKKQGVAYSPRSVSYQQIHDTVLNDNEYWGQEVQKMAQNVKNEQLKAVVARKRDSSSAADDGWSLTRYHLIGALAAGADINTPLQLPGEQQTKLECVLGLCVRHADRSFFNAVLSQESVAPDGVSGGKSPLHEVLQLPDANADKIYFLRQLLQKHANPNQELNIEISGNNQEPLRLVRAAPLFYATKTTVAELLASHGADPKKVAHDDHDKVWGLSPCCCSVQSV
jgi:hypothetical protein